MFRPVDTYTATRAMTLNGTPYAPGEEISRDDIIHSRKADALLSRKFIIPTPDPHARKTKPGTPTPVSTPATYRRAGAPLPDMVVLNPDFPHMTVGETVQMSVMYFPEGSFAPITWSIGPAGNTCASIDQNGLVTALVPGGGTIYAEFGGQYPGQTYLDVVDAV